MGFFLLLLQASVSVFKKRCKFTRRRRQWAGLFFLFLVVTCTCLGCSILYNMCYRLIQKLDFRMGLSLGLPLM